MRMAKLIIDIINPTISLISKPSTSSNKCEGTLEFTIKSTPNASIIIVATIPSGQLDKDDLRELSYDLGAGYQLAPNEYRTTAQYPSLSTDQWTKYKEVTLNNTGEAKVRVVLSNSEKAGEYLTTKVYVKDVTNSKEETKEFTRYNDDIKCKIGLEPIAINDNATIDSGTSKNIYILQNDERIHYIPDLNNVTILTQPTHGTVLWLFGYARYTNNGDGATTDFFTYTVETPNGLSNTATVNITINQEIKVIDNNTNVNIIFDDSGSMGDTLPILKSMVDNELKTKLLPYYDTLADYEARVNISYMGKDERFLRHIANKLDYTGNSIFLIFQNEATNFQNGYQTYQSYDPLEPAYVTDIDLFNNNLNSYTSQFNAVMFQVESGAYPAGFQRWLEFVKKGEGNYSGDKGLSDRNTFNMRYDIFGTTLEGASAQYYTDLIVGELNNLGFNIT